MKVKHQSTVRNISNVDDVDNKAWYARAGLSNICEVPAISNFVVNPIPQYKYFLNYEGKNRP